MGAWSGLTWFISRCWTQNTLPKIRQRFADKTPKLLWRVSNLTGSLGRWPVGGRGAPARRSPAKAPCRIPMPGFNGRLTGNHGETREKREDAEEVGSCRPLG